MVPFHNTQEDEGLDEGLDDDDDNNQATKIVVAGRDTKRQSVKASKPTKPRLSQLQNDVPKTRCPGVLDVSTQTQLHGARTRGHDGG